MVFHQTYHLDKVNLSVEANNDSDRVRQMSVTLDSAFEVAEEVSEEVSVAAYKETHMPMA
jgi:hypothetical protein